MRLLVYLFVLAATSGILVTSCESPQQKTERLARHYCSACHLFPEPGLLDKKTWKDQVLPEMAFRMGVLGYNSFGRIPNEDLPQVMTVLPAAPMVTKEQWVAISNYFITNAPDSLRKNDSVPVDSLKQFTVSQPPLFPKGFTTLLKFDSLNRKFYVGNRFSKLYQRNNLLEPLDSMTLGSPPSHLIVDGDSLLVSAMGIMDPNDQLKGELLNIRNNLENTSLILDSLQRPVYFERADMNKDGLEDFIVCAFGNYTGGLLIFEGRQNGGFTKHVLNSNAGARKIEVRDFDKDGLPDILALMTQGDESVILYRNQSGLNFERKVLVRFPPVYGSSYFESVDFNRDGFFDILCTNGDNGDYSIILKPYHGIRIFENDGRNNFKESWSFAMPGASQARAIDFDRDGDVDIAAISFFPDFERHPEHGFLYFENRGKNEFVAHATSVAATGRWLVMETGDFDYDSDKDILLGSANFRGLGANKTKNKFDNGISLLLLKNKLVVRPE